MLIHKRLMGGGLLQSLSAGSATNFENSDQDRKLRSGLMAGVKRFMPGSIMKLIKSKVSILSARLSGLLLGYELSDTYTYRFRLYIKANVGLTKIEEVQRLLLAQSADVEFAKDDAISILPTWKPKGKLSSQDQG